MLFRSITRVIHSRMLQSGDYVIMLSDGVSDAFSDGVGEEILTEVIGKIEYSNPGEIANQLLAYALRQSRGRIRDDMTVLVTGIWDQEETT